LRTGDIGRLLAGGQIEILSRPDALQARLDRPVDLEEIERTLERHPDVAEALVAQAASATVAGEDSLIAYVVRRPLDTADAAATGALERHVEEWLPPRLRPAAFVMVESLPRTPDGKLDRQWQPPADTTAHGGATLRPSGEIEERLAAIWASMLRVDRVDATGNFFELGGHSLLAARMLAQVERSFGRRIKLATLFVAPSLREFAAIVAQGDSREFDFRQVVKIQPHGSRRPLIAINNTGIYYGLARCLGPEQPVYSLQLFDPSTKSSAMPQTLEEIAAGYVDLIRSVQPEGPYQLMGWCVAGALSFEIARQLEEDNREVAHLFLIDSWVPGYFKRLPRWRGLIGEYSLRLQLIVADWRLVLSREKSLLAFLSERNMFARWRRLMFGGEPSGEKTLDDHATLETYDQWLLAYLQKVTAGYTPRPYHGHVTLLRSSLEPTGWFFHPDAGWAPFIANGVDVQFVEGNHFSMFQHPGAGQMAAHLANAIRS
jgi:thioesterase domain-containing protein